MSDAAPAIAVDGLSKRFDATVALDDVTFSIPQGEIRALIGENGAGKSTLVKILAGLVREDSGHIRVFGDEVALSRPARAHALGIQTAFQEMTLIDDLTVTQNMLLPYEPLIAGQIDRRGSKRAVVRHFAPARPRRRGPQRAGGRSHAVHPPEDRDREGGRAGAAGSAAGRADVHTVRRRRGLARRPHRQPQRRGRDDRLHHPPHGRGAPLLPEPHRAPQRPACGLLRHRRGERRRGGAPDHRPLPRRDLSCARGLPPRRGPGTGLRRRGAHHRRHAGRSLLPALARRGSGYRCAPRVWGSASCSRRSSASAAWTAAPSRSAAGRSPLHRRPMRCAPASAWCRRTARPRRSSSSSPAGPMPRSRSSTASQRQAGSTRKAEAAAVDEVLNDLQVHARALQDRPRPSRAATSRRSRSPSGCWRGARCCSPSIPRAASISAPSTRSTC